MARTKNNTNENLSAQNGPILDPLAEGIVTEEFEEVKAEEKEEE